MIANRFNPLGVTPAMRYIQDGLIVMWDGIENVGWGEHDESATTWKDLAGKYNLDLPTRNHVWEDNCFRCDSVTPVYTTRPKAVFEEMKNGYTAEVCATIGESNGPLISCGNGSNFWNIYSSKLIFSISSAQNGGVGVSLTQGGTYLYPTVIGLSTFYGASLSASFTADIVNQKSRQFLNGGLKATYANAALTGCDNMGLSGIGVNCTGRNTDDWNVGIGGGTKFYCVRFYNRPLTDEEIAHNYAIDKERFGL